MTIHSSILTRALLVGRSSMLIAIAAVLTLALPATSQAVQSQDQTPAPSQALEIAPPVISLKANPGQTISTQINVRNISQTSLVVDSAVNDFGASDREDGSPVVLGLDGDEDSEPSPYSIIDWVNPLPRLQLTPRQIEKLPVTIKVPKSAAPGGYFGVVRFTGTPPDIESSGVALSASLGALVFIRVNGDAKESIEIAEFSANKNNNKGWFFDGAPIEFVQRIKNTGTVYEQPVGRIAVTDMFGNKTANLNVNLDGRFILPGSTRRFSVPLDKSVIGNRFLFGLYTANLTMGYGSDDKTVTKTIRVLVLPWQIILLAVGALLALIIFFRVWLKRRDDRVMSRSRRRR